MWDPLVTFFLIVILLIALVTKTLVDYCKNRKVHKFMGSLPGPVTVPVIGSAYVFAGITVGQNLLKTVLNQLKRYKRNAAIWIFKKPYLLTSDKSVFEAVLGSVQHITKTKDYEHLKGQGTGLLTANGEPWRDMRRRTNPGFQTSVLESFGENFDYHAGIFLDALRKHAIEGETFDILAPTHMCSIDLICDNLLGYRVEAQKNGHVHYGLNMRRSTEMLMLKSFRFIWWSDLLFSLLGKKKKLDDAVKPMRILLSQILEKKLEERRESRHISSEEPGSLKNYIDILVDNVESGAITKDQAVGESGDMFLGGSMTIAVSISWIFKIFAMRPDIQQKVYQEIVDTCGQKVTLSDLSKLEYLEMVIKETLRHFTVPFVGREVKEDVQLQDGRTIPAGVSILMISYDLHHDPEYWERPGEFYPEHFSPENERTRPKGVFFPFLTGPRICPGNTYTIMSLKYLIANTLLHYEFHTDENIPADFREEEYVVVFVLYPVSGLNVKIRERIPQNRTSNNSKATA